MSGITDEMVDKAAIASQPTTGNHDVRCPVWIFQEPLANCTCHIREATLDRARTALEAVVGDIRKQIAEEIAQAIEAKTIDPEWPNDDVSENGKYAARIAREIGGAA